MGITTKPPLAAFSRIGGMGYFRRDPSRLASTERIKALTRERFDLEQDMLVVVAEVACASPGCPPLETVVMFWTNPDTRHQFKVFKPLDQVDEDDLPFRWMKPTLVATEGYGCDCC